MNRSAVPDVSVPVGRIAGAYGIKGWVKITSFTDPAENVFKYAPWTLCDSRGNRPDTVVGVLESKAHGKGWVARLEGVADRNAAEEMKGLQIIVGRDRLPEPEVGQYYWADLEGLQVNDQHGKCLGRIDHLLETGSTDVMVIVDDAGRGNGRCLIPFIEGQTVTSVDLEAGCLQVDWDDEWT
ncbi:MAG: ribosome maturation factor RimM [Gammaproteobacteria bacterium]|nr:ribosome maturation factor RimM [Gammaproteobacteria bacterium]NND53584.1 ribosome maturation factor RimM [Gammaproteobacteria bacterium]